MAKISREKFKTRNDVFDNFTIRTLFELSSKGYFQEIESPVSIGKESNVFTAKTKEKERVIVKIYRLMVCDFTRMHRYITEDPRFQGLHNNRRKTVFAWAQREYRNLLTAREYGARVPQPIIVKNNVLVMSMIGKEAPAPKLKDEPPEDINNFYKETIKQFKALTKANLAHGDLSPFNILNDNGKPAIIDISHGTPLNTTLGKELFQRDVETLSKYFIKNKMKTTSEEMLKEIMS